MVTALILVGCLVGAVDAADAEVIVHTVESPLQAGPTKVKVLLPVPFDREREYPVVYLLPVEAAEQSKYGDALDEILQKQLHKTHQVIFVAPTFSALPWYADHPTDKTKQQETYFLKRVIPLVEGKYRTQRGAKGRVLLGFSKSGWGAWSLLLRNPEMFASAAAWDAPLTMASSGQYGSGAIFGTQENFAGYKLLDLVESEAATLRESPRLIMTGYGGFRSQHERMHRKLEQLKIPHEYRDGPRRKHDWHSGWVAESLALLLK